MSGRKKVIVIGGGIAGLTAGIYCLDNGFDVDLYEKHVLPGGQCTGWYRNGAFIDGCLHWLIGTNPNSDLYPIWRHIDILPPGLCVYPTNELTALRVGEKTLHLYGDLDQLKEELTNAFPEDKKPIASFIRAIKAYERVRIPTKKPLDRMNLFELMRFGIPMLPMVFAYLKYSKISIEEYVERFQNKQLRDVFLRTMREDYSVHSLLYVLQALSRKDAGVPEGGSLEIARRVAAKFTSLGGRLHLKQEVRSVVYEKKMAKGIKLDDGVFKPCDDLIIACDINYAVNHLLPEKAKESFFAKRMDDVKAYPANTGFTLSFLTSKDMISFPKQYDFPCEEKELHGLVVNHIPLRNHSFDQSLMRPKGKTLLTVLLPAKDAAYEGWNALTPELYLAAKTTLTNLVAEAIRHELHLSPEELEPLDCATPCTYERYCNAYKGSYMSFIATKFNKRLMEKGTFPGIKNLALCGQWLMLPGGIPIAGFSGKNAAYRISKRENGRFWDYDESAPLKSKP